MANNIPEFVVTGCDLYSKQLNTQINEIKTQKASYKTRVKRFIEDANRHLPNGNELALNEDEQQEMIEAMSIYIDAKYDPNIKDLTDKIREITNYIMGVKEE